jgi:hypothetical protein
MFDGLRNDASDTSGFDEQVEYFPEDKPPSSAPRAKRRSSRKIWGMDAQQRFIISIMLMIAMCTMGAMCMFVFGKFVLP